MDASNFQPEPHTEDKPDKWLILTLRMLEYIDCPEAAKGLEGERERLQTEIEELRLANHKLEGECGHLQADNQKLKAKVERLCSYGCELW